jgi:chromosome segregation ATPase
MCPEHVDISNSTSPTSQQTELSEADRHNLMITEYNDSWNTLTRKIITITRLHAHEKGQLQAKIKELERAASSSSKKVSDAKKQMKKAQEKHKQAQEKIKKVQGQKREVEEKIRSAEAEVFKAQEEAQEAKGEAENYKVHRSTANKLCASAQNDAMAWEEQA